MRKFLMTSPKFNGAIEFLYSHEEKLLRVDLTNASCSVGQIRKLLSVAPCTIEELRTAFADTQAAIVESDFEVTFEMFWEKYDLKRNKKHAEKLWSRMNAVDRAKAYLNIDSYNKYCKRNEWYNKMYPDTFLRGEHYQTEWDKLNR